MTSPPKSVETIYNAAILLPAAADRAEYVARACGGDEALRHRVEALLQSYADSGGAGAAPWEEATRLTQRRPEPSEGVGTTVGRYKLLDRLGEGGFGEVYRAEQSEPVRRQVALKVVKLGMDTKEVIGRFATERQVLALLDHPNIARVFDAGATAAGRPYFVMELVHGVPITQYCDDSQLPTHDRIALFMTVCGAIQHAHQKGIIHRDLKPSNILISSQSGRAEPKVIDFGIAKATQASLTEEAVFTQAHQFIGTPAYMSPEQAGSSGLDIDTRSDVYSLGILLYELLTGRTPFETKDLLGSGYDELRRNLREREPPKPSTRLSTLAKDALAMVARHRRTDPVRLTSSLRGDLDWIVLKALEKDRARRYESASALAEDLRRYLAHEPVSAARPSKIYLFGKFVRRNRGVLAAAAAVTAALILGTAVSVRQAMRANRNAEFAGVQAGIARQATTNAQIQAQLALQERNNAQRAEARTKQVFSRSDFQIAAELLERNQDAQAVAHLTRAIRSDPDHHAAAARLLRTLARGRYLAPPLVVPIPEPKGLPPDPQVGSPRFAVVSPDGTLILVISGTEATLLNAADASPRSPPLTLTCPPTSAAIAPDDRFLVVAATNGVAEAWDLASGRRTGQTFTAASATITSIAFSPDGQRFALVSVPANEMMGLASVRVWDRAQTEALATVETGQPVRPGLGFSHDGSWLAVTWQNESTNGFVIRSLVDQTSRRIMAGSRAIALAITPDDSRLVTSCEDNVIRVWETATGRVTAELRGHADPSPRVFLTPAGTRILTSSSDATLRIWDLAAGQALLPPLLHGPSSVAEQGAAGQPLLQIVGVSPDGLRVATLRNHQLRIWSVATGELLLGPVDSRVGDLGQGQFSQAGSHLIIHDQTAVEIWPMTTPASLTTRLHQDGFHAAQAIAPNGRWIATAFTDRTVRLWDPATGAELTPPLRHAANPSRLVISGDSTTLATVANTTISVWDASKGALRCTLPGGGTVRELLLSRSGERVAARAMEFSRRKGGAMNEWQIWDVAAKRRLLFEEGRGLGQQRAIMSEDGRRVALTEPDGILVKDLGTLEAVGPKLAGHAVAALSADGSLLALVSEDGSSVQVWDSATGKTVGAAIARRGESAVSWSEAARFTPDGRRLVLLDGERRVSVYDFAEGRPVGQPIRLGERSAIEDLSEDGRYLLTSQAATSGRSTRVWELATGSPVTSELPTAYQQFVQGGRWLACPLPELLLEDLPFGDLALPEWFLAFAESLVGQRYNEHGLLEPVPGSERARLGREVARRTGAGDLLRWAGWLAAPAGGGSNSPFSPLDLDAFVANQRPVQAARAEDAWGGVMIASRRESLPTTNELSHLLERHPLHPLALAEYGMQLAASTNRLAQAEADWFTRRANELATNSPAVCGRRAEYLLSVGRFEAALAVLAPALKTAPNSAALQRLQGRILLRLGRLAGSVTAFTAAIQHPDYQRDLSGCAGRQALLERAEACRAQGQIALARDDSLEAMNIPQRTAGLDTALVDLSSAYNASLDETRLPLLVGRPFGPMDYEEVEGNDLSPVPRGNQDFSGIPFDVRGVVQLSSAVLQRNKPDQWPTHVSGIGIDQNAGRLHFLLGVGTTRRMMGENDPNFSVARIAGMAPRLIPPGREVARFQLHYQDGSTQVIPVRLDFEVHDVRMFARDEWELPAKRVPGPGFQPVWTGVNPAGVRLMLGRLTWDNPHPGRRIEQLDFHSAMTEGAPFLLAVTAEPLTNYVTNLDAYAQELLQKGSFADVGLAWEVAPEQTSARIADRLASHPEDPTAWLHDGFLKLHRGQTIPARDALQQALAHVPRDAAHTSERARAVGGLTRAMLALGQAADAAQTNCLAFGIPQRPVEAASAQIDLSLQYNGALTGSWMSPGRPERNDLSELAPLGIKQLGGVAFDVRGVVQLANADMMRSNAFPDRVEGIRVARRCQKIHFLHATGWGNGPPGTPIGHYLVHYADGGQAQVEMKLGDDLWDWWAYPNQPRETRHSEVVWTGSNEYARQFNAQLQLFKTSWTNLRPDVEIQTIDFSSAAGVCAPFLIAITAE